MMNRMNMRLSPRRGGIKLKRLGVLAALTGCGLHSGAHQAGLDYSSELQTAFGREANWVNLLQLQGQLDLTSRLSARAATISCATMRECPLLDDLLTYSNIEESNIPLAISRLGVGWENDRCNLFAGIGNVNDAFFVTPVTSLFTNSSCGIFPTLSCNFPIANFPDASFGIEGEYDFDGVRVNSALYDGRSSHSIVGSGNVWRLDLKHDGVFNINAVNYDTNDSNYNLGVGVYHGRCDDDDQGAPEAEFASLAPTPSTQLFYWLYAEQRLAPGLSMIAQFSQCPAIESGCRTFCGGGFAWQLDRYDLGVYTCYADFTEAYEWASELTARYRVSDHIELQTSLHYIRNTSARGLVGLLRLSLSL